MEDRCHKIIDFPGQRTVLGIVGVTEYIIGSNDLVLAELINKKITEWIRDRPIAPAGHPYGSHSSSI